MVLVYSLLISFMTGPFIWVTIITTGVGFVGLSYILNHYVNLKYSGIDSYIENLQSEEPNYMAIAMKSSVGLLWIFAAIYFTCVFCHISNIRISTLVLGTTSQIVLRNFYVLLIPAICTVKVVMWCVWWAYGLMYLLSTGEIDQPTNGSQIKRIYLDWDTKWMVFGHVLFGYWVYEILQTLHNYVLICGVCEWYFTSN